MRSRRTRGDASAPGEELLARQRAVSSDQLAIAAGRVLRRAAVALALLVVGPLSNDALLLVRSEVAVVVRLLLRRQVRPRRLVAALRPSLISLLPRHLASSSPRNVVARRGRVKRAAPPGEPHVAGAHRGTERSSGGDTCRDRSGAAR